VLETKLDAQVNRHRCSTRALMFSVYVNECRSGQSRKVTGNIRQRWVIECKLCVRHWSVVGVRYFKECRRRLREYREVMI